MMIFYLFLISFATADKFQNVKVGENIELDFEMGSNILDCAQHSTRCLNPNHYYGQYWPCCDTLEFILEREFLTLEDEMISLFPEKFTYSNEKNILTIHNVTFREGEYFSCTNYRQWRRIQLNIVSQNLVCANVSDKIICIVEYSSRDEMRLMNQTISNSLIECKQNSTRLICPVELSNESVYLEEINKLRESNCTSLAIFLFESLNFNKTGMMQFAFPDAAGFIYTSF